MMDTGPASKNARPVPFDFGLYGLIVIGLGFLFAMTYFLIIATLADEIIWRIASVGCGDSPAPFDEKDLYGNQMSTSMATYYGGPLLLGLAFFLERVISTRSHRNAECAP